MLYDNPQNEIQNTENEIFNLVQKLEKLREENKSVEVKNYKFKDLNGDVALLDLFLGKDKLFAIHNMGQGCRYCTLWADGVNPFLPHLEDKFSVVLLSKDAPETQRKLANSRGWRFRMLSHGGSEYIKEQSVVAGAGNMPGVVVYERKGDKIFKKNFSAYGPGDLFCSIWHFLSLAGENSETWTPQYNYWHRPEKMDDGGKNVN